MQDIEWEKILGLHWILRHQNYIILILRLMNFQEKVKCAEKKSFVLQKN